MHLVIAWIWQGLALVLLAAGIIRLWRPRAAARHLAWCTVLLGVLALPLTWVGGGETDPAAARLATEPIAAGIVVAPPDDRVVSAAIGVWLGVVLLALVSLAQGLAALRRVKARSTPLGRDREARLRGWMAARPGRGARLVVSDDVPLAATLGLGTPVIAVNRKLAEALDDDELDQLVLHELAHVRRFDDWIGLAQAVVEAFWRLHPAVWWIGRRLRFEREVAADEWVVSRTGAPHAYAACLAAVASVSLARDAGGLAIGAGARRGDLLRRVQRVLRSADRPVRPFPRLGYGVLAAALGAAVVGLGQLPHLVRFETMGVPRLASSSHPPPKGGTEASGPDRDVRARASSATAPADDPLRILSTLARRPGSGGGRLEPRGPAAPAPPGRAEASPAAAPMLASARIAFSTFESPVASRGARGRGASGDGRGAWLGLPTLATRTSDAATRTAASITRATVAGAVGTGQAVTGASRAGATHTFDWFRRRLGFGSERP